MLIRLLAEQAAQPVQFHTTVLQHEQIGAVVSLKWVAQFRVGQLLRSVAFQSQQGNEVYGPVMEQMDGRQQLRGGGLLSGEHDAAVLCMQGQPLRVLQSGELEGGPGDGQGLLACVMADGKFHLLFSPRILSPAASPTPEAAAR